eukprot:c28680_g2_i1 orf=1500-2795(+)
MGEICSPSFSGSWRKAEMLAMQMPLMNDFSHISSTFSTPASADKQRIFCKDSSCNIALPSLVSPVPPRTLAAPMLCPPNWRGVSRIRRPLCSRGEALKIVAIDAAQPFDFESKRQCEIDIEKKLKIGIVGFGNFGQFLANNFVKQGHEVLAHSRSDYRDLSRRMGITYFRDPDDFCEEHPEVIVLCTSILSTESVLRSLPVQRLKRSTLFVDVLSVKEFPKNLLLQVLPPEYDVLCTHPMFGPQSGKTSWFGLPFVYEKVRIGEGARADRCKRLLNVFASEGCRMVEMTCAEHDRYAASSQFITHTVGRVLGMLGLESTPINTKGYETLLDMVENTGGDSFDLYYGLFMYNVNATEELTRLELAFDAVKKQLFEQLHDVLRKQLFGASVAESIPATSMTAKNIEVASAELAKLRKTTGRLESNSVNNFTPN